MIKIQRVAAAALPADLAGQLDSFSLFSSTIFAALWQSMHGRPTCWLLHHDGAVAAVLTGVEFRPRPLTRFQAMVDGLYGRLWIAPGCPLDRAEALSSFMAELRLAGYARVFVTDFHNEFANPRRYVRHEWETSLVTINDPNWEPPDATLRAEIRKAEREGVQVEAYHPDLHREKFLALMAATERRHRRPPKYTPAFFDALSHLATTDRRIQWRYCEIDGRPAASHIFLIDGPMALHWQVYFDKSFSHAKPNQYILHATARRLAAEGVTHLNLGGSPPDAEGLAAYKVKWGGVPHKYSTYSHYSWLGRFL